MHKSRAFPIRQWNVNGGGSNRAFRHREFPASSTVKIPAHIFRKRTEHKPWADHGPPAPGFDWFFAGGDSSLWWPRYASHTTALCKSLLSMIHFPSGKCDILVFVIWKQTNAFKGLLYLIYWLLPVLFMPKLPRILRRKVTMLTGDSRQRSGRG